MIGLETLQRLSHRTGDLVFLGFEESMRLCSRETLHVLGQEWLQADFGVQPDDVGPQGIEGIRITLGDSDFSWAARLRTKFSPGIACEWHLVYRGAMGWESELQFSGELEAASINHDGSVEVTAITATGHTAWSPRVPFESRHSLPSGAEVRINGTTYRIE